MSPSSKRPPGTRPHSADQSKRLLNLPSALWDDPAYWGGWVLVGAEHRRHILGYVNEQGHVPPWVERQLRVGYEAIRGWKTRP